MKNNAMLKYGLAAVLLVVLFNLPLLMKLSFDKPIAEKTVIDPSGYYNLTHPPAKQEEKKEEDKTSTFIADFFGLPAVILCLAVWLVAKREKQISLLKAFVFFLFSWIIYEVVAYSQMIFGASTMGLGAVIAPILATAAMYLFLKLSAGLMGIQISGGTKAMASLVTAVLCVIPVVYFFRTADMNNFAVLLIIIWQLVAVWALSKQWALHLAQKPDETDHLVSEVSS
jgi:hypothetical protein